jgi:TatD DNase family protein
MDHGQQESGVAGGPVLVDSHAHLDLCGDDPSATVKEAREAGLGRILAVGIDLDSSRRAVDQASRFPEVLACVGIHPNEAAGADDAAFAELEQLARSPRCAAIGETGLDYYRDRSPREVQVAAFMRHLELARATGLPLVVHTREAAADTMRILAENADGITVVLHCFSLSEEVAECARRGYYMSLAGNVTFKNAANLRGAAVDIPPELLLTETDSPFLTPVPYRGQPNRPAHVGLVTACLARERGVALTGLAAQVLTNYDRVFSPARASA